MTATPKSIAPFLDMMRQQLLGEGCTLSNIAFAECLDREKLDFSVDSLHVIDRYLNGVHDREQDVFGLPLLTTIWATSMYIGEIIRREIPAKNFEWVTIGEELSANGETTIGCPDIGSIRALRSREGEMVMPSRAVLRKRSPGSARHGVQRETYLTMRLSG